MKPLTRIGILVLIVGLSFMSVTFIRSASTSGFAFMFISVPATSYSVSDVFWFPPQEIKLSVSADSNVDVYLLNSEDLQLWEKTEEINAISEFKNVQQGVYYLQLPQRGGYAFLVYNNSNSTTGGQINVTLFGIETDLLVFSLLLMLSGFVIFCVALAIRKTVKVT